MTLAPRPSPMRARLRDRQDLMRAMAFNRLNVIQLARLCGLDDHGHARHRSTLSHLHAGIRDTCSLPLARRIEEILRTHPGALFTPYVSSVKSDAPTHRHRPTSSKPRKKAA